MLNVKPFAAGASAALFALLLPTLLFSRTSPASSSSAQDAGHTKYIPLQAAEHAVDRNHSLVLEYAVDTADYSEMRLVFHRVSKPELGANASMTVTVSHDFLKEVEIFNSKVPVTGRVLNETTKSLHDPDHVWAVKVTGKKMRVHIVYQNLEIDKMGVYLDAYLVR